MPESSVPRPVQVFLDTNSLIYRPQSRGGGGTRDFFEGDNAGFIRHRDKIAGRLRAAASGIDALAPVGFVLVQMSEKGLAKSYRPVRALFTEGHGFGLVGGQGPGEMYFQATPERLNRLASLIIEKAEEIPRTVEDPDTGQPVERVSAWRSEVGAIADVRLPSAEEKVGFSAEEAVEKISRQGAFPSYSIELFRPESRLAREQVEILLRDFIARLAQFPGLDAAITLIRPQGTPQIGRLSAKLVVDGHSFLSIPEELNAVVKLEQSSAVSTRAGEPELSPRSHQAFLDFLSKEVLVRQVDLPIVLETSPHASDPVLLPPDFPGPGDIRDVPLVGIVDGGVARMPLLNTWRMGEIGGFPEQDIDEEHGTFIAGLLAGGAALNPAVALSLEAGGCGFLDLRIIPRKGLLAHYYQSEEDFFDQLDTMVEAAKRDHGVRVFNFSLGSRQARKPYDYSRLARALDEIAIRHDVIFLVSAGNLEGLHQRGEWPKEPAEALAMLARGGSGDDRITPPADHFLGLSVGAMNPPGLSGVTMDVPTAYTRRGPGAGGARKPELVHYGGAASRGGNQTGLFSLSADGKLVASSGTSYATPLAAATIAALDKALGSRAPRETLLALPVHKARRSRLMDHRSLVPVARDFVGFGLCPTAERLLEDDDYSITLVFSGVLQPDQELQFDFAWPAALTGRDGRCRGRADVTLACSPDIDPSYGAEALRVQLDASLYQLQEKIESDGSVKEEAISRLKHVDSKLPKDLEYTERYLLENGLKWSPLKRYYCNMTRGAGRSGTWKLKLSSQSRAGAVLSRTGVPFTLLMTLSDPSRRSEIYDDVRSSIVRQGFRLSDIQVMPQIRPRA